MSDFAKALQEYLNEGKERPPKGEGWKTQAEIAAAEEIPLATVKNNMAKLVKAGKYESKKFYGDNANGKLQRLFFYRPVKGKK